MSSFTLLALPIIFWLLPVWYFAALYCESIAARKNQPAGEWFFRGMALNLSSLSQIVFEPAAEGKKDFSSSDDPMNQEATATLISILLILVGIPFYSTLVITVFSVFWRFFENRTFPLFVGTYFLTQVSCWFILVWLGSILGSIYLARYKGMSPKIWAALAVLGAEIPFWILLKSEPDYDSRARQERFLEDELTVKLVNRLMTAIAVPCRIAMAAAVIAVLALLIGLVVTPAIAKSIVICPRDLILVGLLYLVTFTGWLLPACYSWLLASCKGLNRVRWTLLGFFAMGLAPLTICLKKSALPETPPAFSSDRSIDHILRLFIGYGMLPWLTCVFVMLLVAFVNDFHLLGDVWSSKIGVFVSFLLAMAQFVFCPLLLVLFFIAKGKRRLNEVVPGALPKVILCLALIQVLGLYLLIFLGAVTIVHMIYI